MKIVILDFSDEPNDYSQWVQELTALSERDVDAGILEEFINLGVESLPEIIALNRLTDKKLAKYNSLYRKKCKLEVIQRIKVCFGH